MAQVRVRYSETDQMGVVYNGNYASYFEIGRTEALRQMGLSYKGIEEKGLMMPVLELHCRFHKPAVYDDLLTIRTVMKEMPGVRLRFDHEIFNEKEELITTGFVTLVCMKTDTRRPCMSPPELIRTLQPYFETS